MTPPVVLTIAGSDPIGGAGMQADLRTFAAFGVHGATALTAVTAQTTNAVNAFWPVEPAQLQAQLDGILSDLNVAAVKTGLLPTAELVDVVTSYAADGRLPNLVVDPVLVNRTGQPFVQNTTIESYERLLPHAVLATPNRFEAELINLELPKLAVVTNSGVDTVTDGTELRADHIETANTRGTGDTFSAGVASRLAHGDPIDVALALAKEWVTAAIAGAVDWKLGEGPSPIDQMHWEYQGTNEDSHVHAKTRWGSS